VPVALAIAAVLTLTPAGAEVHRWIDKTLGVRHASPALFSLPAPGKLLVSGPGGAWTVAGDGAKRRLGPWQQASWSPRALFVVVASGDQLAAVDPHGIPSWTLARLAVRFASWFPPSGYRIAYLSGSTLRVVAGDGTGDHALAGHVAPIAPAWRAGHEYQLAYESGDGAIILRDGDTGAVVWSRRFGGRLQLLRWSADGSRLLVLTRDAAIVLDGNGSQVAREALGSGQPLLDGAISPDGHTIALLRNGDVTLVDLTAIGQAPRQVFAGDGLRQLAWSPDGNWLLVSWPPADQWIFIRASGRPRIAAASRIAEQLALGTAHRPFPELDGWCCTVTGTAR
jgi:hypothetical protein